MAKTKLHEHRSNSIDKWPHCLGVYPFTAANFILGINLGMRCLTVHHVLLVKLHCCSEFSNCFKTLFNYRHKQVLHNSTANVMTSVNPLSPHIVKVKFCSVSHTK